MTENKLSLSQIQSLVDKMGYVEADIDERCCGNCLHFTHEDVEGRGICEETDTQPFCGYVCAKHAKR